MTVYSWLWVGWGLMFVGVETLAIVSKDKPAADGQPAKLRTLSANLRWVASAAGWWHVAARIVMAGVLVWLLPHLGLL